MQKKGIYYLAQGGVIAALYTAITLAFAPVAFGIAQLRVSEALTVLPFFTPAAVPGLFVGCVIANLIGGFGVFDVVFGSLATLLAALATYKIRNKWLAPLPSVLCNGVIVGGMLYFLGLGEGLPIYLVMLYVAGGQMAACYGLGLPLLLAMERYGKKLFPQGGTVV